MFLIAPFQPLLVPPQKEMKEQYCSWWLPYEEQKTTWCFSIDREEQSVYVRRQRSYPKVDAGVATQLATESAVRTSIIRREITRSCQSVRFHGSLL